MQSYDAGHFASLRLFGGVEPVPEINAKIGALALGLLAAIWALFYERRRGEPPKMDTQRYFLKRTPTYSL